MSVGYNGNDAYNGLQIVYGTLTVQDTGAFILLKATTALGQTAINFQNQGFNRFVFRFDPAADTLAVASRNDDGSQRAQRIIIPRGNGIPVQTDDGFACKNLFSTGYVVNGNTTITGLDVTGISEVVLNAGSATLLNNFSGGSVGQHVYLWYQSAIVLTVAYNNTTGGQKILTPNAVNYVSAITDKYRLYHFYFSPNSSAWIMAL